MTINIVRKSMTIYFPKTQDGRWTNRYITLSWVLIGGKCTFSI